MTNDRFLKYIDDYVSHPEIEEHAKKLVAVVNSARALKGDLDAADESPTHHSSYFTLTEALEKLELE